MCGGNCKCSQAKHMTSAPEGCGCGGNCGCGRKAGVYHCAGTCQHSDIFPGVCETQSCANFHKPLVGYKQCDGCKSAVGRDNGVHWCTKCMPQEKK